MTIPDIDIRALNILLAQFNMSVNGTEEIAEFEDTGVGYYLTIIHDVATVVSLPTTINNPIIVGYIDDEPLTGYVCFVSGDRITLECFTYDRNDFDYRSDRIRLVTKESG